MPSDNIPTWEKVCDYALAITLGIALAFVLFY